MAPKHRYKARHNVPLAFQSNGSSTPGLQPGDRVRIKNARVVDRERSQEGMHDIPQGKRPPLDVDISHAEGVVAGGGYVSPTKGETCVLVRLRTGGNVVVPISKLKRTRSASSRASASLSRGGLTRADRELIRESIATTQAALKAWLESMDAQKN